MKRSEEKGSKEPRGAVKRGKALPALYQIDNIFNDIENPIGTPVDQYDVPLENRPLPVLGQARQPMVQVGGQRLQAFLQARRSEERRVGKECRL